MRFELFVIKAYLCVMKNVWILNLTAVVSML